MVNIKKELDKQLNPRDFKIPALEKTKRALKKVRPLKTKKRSIL